MALSAANLAAQAHCLVLFMRLLGLLPQRPGGSLPRASSGGNSARCALASARPLSLRLVPFIHNSPDVVWLTDP